MRLPLFLFFSSLPVFLFSQLAVQNKITDSTTGLPVENAEIQNLSGKQNRTHSDEAGRFTVSGAPGDSLEFRCVGYRPRIVLLQEIQQMTSVKMKRNVYDLEEVVITVDDANLLLQKAEFNLKSKLLLNTEIPYLYHGMRRSTESESEVQMYTLFSSRLKKINPKKPQLPFQLNLIWKKESFASGPDSTYLKKIPVLCNYYPLDFTLKKIKNNYKVLLESYNDSVFSIVCKPKGNVSDTVFSFLISKEDTVLLSYQAYFKSEIPVHMKKIVIFADFYQYSHSWKFNRWEDAYYISSVSLETIFSYYVKGRDKGRDDLITESIVVHALPESDIPFPSTGKKLNGRSRQLYEMKDTTEDDFWIPYINCL